MSVHPDFISVTYGPRGYFPVHMVWKFDAECYMRHESHPYSSSDKEDAANVAKKWAEKLGIQYVCNSFGGD